VIPWKSNARFNEQPENGSSFTAKVTRNPVTIHKYVGLGDSLFLSCHALNLDMIDLHTTDFNEAAKTARSLIRKALSELNKDFEGFLEDEHDIIERY
jgi:hypothetical protein